MIKCQACRGTKIIVGMGSIEKKCESCNGIGFKEVEKITIEETVTHGESSPNQGASVFTYDIQKADQTIAARTDEEKYIAKQKALESLNIVMNRALKEGQSSARKRGRPPKKSYENGDEIL